MYFSTSAIIAVVAMASSVEAQTPGLITGYSATNDVNSYLNRDLIQQTYEGIMSDESCPAFDAGCAYWNDDADPNLKGGYLKSMPTYTDTISDEYNEFIQCTGFADFHIKWVDGACAKDKVDLDNSGANFKKCFGTNGNDLTSAIGDCVGYEEVTKKATSYVFMKLEVYQLMQKAITLAATCKAQAPTFCVDAKLAWDAAVAIYSGSLEGADGNQLPGPCGGGSYGKTMYSLADKRCDDFGTCGPDTDGFDREISSYANIKIMQYFAAGGLAIYGGDVTTALYWKRKVAAQLNVGLIQGTLRYGYRLSNEAGGGTFSTADKYVGEGGTFAFGVLCNLWACSKKGFKKAETEIKIGGSKACKKAINFDNLRLGFECNYKCLGITCKEIGALFDGDNCDANDVLIPGALPRYEACDDKKNGSDPTDIAKCVPWSGARKKKCKKFIGQAGIASRDKDEYHLNGLSA